MRERHTTAPARAQQEGAAANGGSESQRPLQLQVNLILYRLTEMDLSNFCCWRRAKSNLNNSTAAPIFKLLLF